MRIALLICLGLVTASCSGGENSLPVTPKDMAMTPPDLAVVLDLAILPDIAKPILDLSQPLGPTDANGVACGMMTCAVGQQCCVTAMGMQVSAMCQPQCDTDAGQVVVACDGPEDCPGGNPCCGKFSANGMTMGAVACGAQPTDCPPMVDIQSRSGNTRLCHVDADCTRNAPNTQLPQCCSVKQNGVTVHVCLSQIIAGFIGGSCP